MKNLEDEYKRFHQEETPDLWNRIEAGLTDKKVKPKKNIFTFKYASVCAAAVLLAILLPGIYFFSRNGRKNADTTQQNMMSAAGNGAADINGMAEDKDFMCEASDSILQDIDVEAAGGEMSGVSTEENDGALPAAEDSDGLDMQGNSESASRAPESDSIPLGGEKPAEQLLGNMEVTDTEQKEGCTVYYLRAEDGRTVSAAFGGEVETELQIGETYLFTLKVSGEEAWEYVIEAAE